MDRTFALPLGLCLAFFSLLITAKVIVNNPSEDTDLNGINVSLWQDLPLESDDKTPIVLIAKPFAPSLETNISSEQISNLTSAATPLFPAHSIRINVNQTEDFFASGKNNNVLITDPIERTIKANLSSPYESQFSNYKFINFRKKFSQFSRLNPL